MKALITDVQYVKEFKTKYGVMYSFRVKYDDESALYSSKYKDQNKFIVGQEAEFTEEVRTYNDNQGNVQEYKIIKPLAQNRQSNFGKALGKEKARYSAMAVSYSKDLVIGGRIQLSELPDYAWIMFELMNEMDKTLEA